MRTKHLTSMLNTKKNNQSNKQTNTRHNILHGKKTNDHNILHGKNTNDHRTVSNGTHGTLLWQTAGCTSLRGSIRCGISAGPFPAATQRLGRSRYGAVNGPGVCSSSVSGMWLWRETPRRMPDSAEDAEPTDAPPACRRGSNGGTAPLSGKVGASNGG